MLIRLLRSHLRPYSGQITLIVLAQLVSTMASLYLPSLNGEIIDEGVAKGDTGFIPQPRRPHARRQPRADRGRRGRHLLAARVAMAMGRDVRGRVFGKVVEFSAQEVTRFGAPTLISRNTNDVTRCRWSSSWASRCS